MYLYDICFCLCSYFQELAYRYDLTPFTKIKSCYLKFVEVEKNIRKKYSTKTHANEADAKAVSPSNI